MKGRLLACVAVLLVSACAPVARRAPAEVAPPPPAQEEAAAVALDLPRARGGALADPGEEAAPPDVKTCFDRAMTTVDLRDCNAMETAELELELQRLAFDVHDVAPAADVAFARATAAHEAFVIAAGALAGDLMRGGSLEPLTDVGRRNELRAERIRRVDEWLVGRPAELAPPPRDVSDADAPRRALQKKADAAWRVYRDAELAARALLPGPARHATNAAVTRH